MHYLQPLTEKVDTIEWFPFYKWATKKLLYDIIIDDMMIFEWVDEDGEKYEYMYFLSDKNELHKMKLIPSEIHRQLRYQGYRSTQAGFIARFKDMLSSHIDTIPLLSMENFHNTPLDINYRYFKCRVSRFSCIRICLTSSNFKNLLPENGEICTDVDDYVSFYKNRIVHCGFGINLETGKDEESGLWRITSEDIGKGNAILRKVIAYLETIVPNTKS